MCNSISRYWKLFMYQYRSILKHVFMYQNRKILERFQGVVSVDTGAVSGCQHRSIMERFRVQLSVDIGTGICVCVYTSIDDTGTFPLW